MAETEKTTTREQIMREFNRKTRALRIECDHRGNKGPTLRPAEDSNDRTQRKLGAGYLVCTRCGEAIPTESFSKEDFANAYETIRGMCNQIKVLGNPTDDDMEQIKGIMNYLDELNNMFAPFYFEQMKKLTNNNNKGRGNNERSKGRIGLTSSQFNTR